MAAACLWFVQALEPMTDQNTVFISIYCSEHVSKLVPVYPYNILYLMGFEPTYALNLDYKSSTMTSRPQQDLSSIFYNNLVSIYSKYCRIFIKNAARYGSRTRASRMIGLLNQRLIHSATGASHAESIYYSRNPPDFSVKEKRPTRQTYLFILYLETAQMDTFLLHILK